MSSLFSEEDVQNPAHSHRAAASQFSSTYSLMSERAFGFTVGEVLE